MSAAKDPLITARTFIGREIKLLVAPTICMVFIRNLLLYIANRIVLSMRMMDRIEKIPASMIRPTRIYCMVGPIFSTKEAGKLTLCTTIEFCSSDAFIAARLSFCT